MFNPSIQFGVLCIILNLLHPCLECPYFECMEDTPKSEPNISTNSLENEIENHLPQKMCTPIQSFKIVLNPYKDVIECLTPKKIFKSGCLRCAACLAIAQQIDESMGELQLGTSDPKEEIEKIENTLKSVCTNGFKEYDLRNYKGHTILMKASASTSHVSSEMNGRWQCKLREICSRYLENIKVSTFYAILLQKSYAIENYLCRGDGVFRDCYNVDFNKNPIIIEEECNTEIPDIRFMLKCST